MRSLKGKIILMNVLIAIIVAAVVGTICIVELNRSNSAAIIQYEKSLRDDYDSSIKYQVENAVSLIDGIYKKQVMVS